MCTVMYALIAHLRASMLTCTPRNLFLCGPAGEQAKLPPPSLPQRGELRYSPPHRERFAWLGAPGALAIAHAAPTRGQLQRSAVSGLEPWPRTLGPTTSSSSPRRTTGTRRPRSSSEVRAHRPRPPSLARSDPARVLGRSRARAPPPARVSPSPRPRRPSLAHLTPPRTCPARRPRCVSARWALVLVGRASEDYLKGSSGRAVNELVGPRVPRATAHPRALPAGAGVGATRGRGDADAAAETPAAAVDSAAAVPSIATAIAAAVAAVAVAFRSPPRRPRRPRLPRHAPRRLPLSTAVVAATDARVRRRRRRCRPHCPQRRRRRRRRCRRRRSGIQGVGGSPPGR